VRGLCFVNVTFTAAIVLDLWSFDAPGKTLNITLLQCVLMGLSIKGSGARVHVSVTSSMLDSGALEFEDDFGASSQILVAGSKLLSTSSHAIQFPRFTLGANSTLLLLDNNMEGESYAVYFPVAVVVDGSGIIIKGNMLKSIKRGYSSESAVYYNDVDLKNGGYIDVENNTISAAIGIFFLGYITVSSAGLLRVADCTFTGSTEAFNSALVQLYGSVILQGGAQWRVEGNNVSASSVLSMPFSWYSIELSGSGTTVSLAHNRQADSSKAFAKITSSGLIVTSPAQFVVGCNMKDGVCVCACGSGGYGEACVPVGAPALPPAAGTASSVFVRENLTVRSVFVVPAGASEVTLRHVVLDGVSPVLYVPWMARDGVRIVVQNVSLRNGAVLYVMGGGALRGAVAAGSNESGPVELSVCDVEALNGALVLTGTYPAGSALTVTDTLLVSARPTPLVYLSGSQSSPYAPVLVLSGLRLVRSVLVVSGVALVTVMTGGRTVVVDGAVLELVGGGVALDA
ncbi:dispersed gene family protein 1 (DGF-1), partial [Trypanosoma cruzi]